MHIVLLAVVVCAAALAFRSSSGTDGFLVAGIVLAFAFVRIWSFGLTFLAARASLDVIQGGDPIAPIVGPAALSGALLLGVATVWLAAQALAGALVKPSLVTRAFGLLAVVSIVSAMAAPHPAFSLGVSLRIVMVAMALAFFEQLGASRPERWKWIVASIAFSAVGPILVAWTQLSERDEIGRLTGTFIHANTFGTYLTVVLTILVIFRPQLQPVARLCANAVIAAGLVALIFTLSRGAWIGMLVALTLVGLTQQRRLLPLIAVGVLAVGLWAPSVGERVADLNQSNGETPAFGIDPNSLAFRQRYWTRLLGTYNESPIIGQGIGSSEDVLSQGRFRERYRYEPHNIYVQALVEMGALGVSALGFVIAAGARDLRRAARLASSRPERAIALSASVVSASLLIQGLSDNVLTSGVVMVYWAAIVGTAIGTTAHNNLPTGRHSVH
jgi:O-antigen ligase